MNEALRREDFSSLGRTMREVGRERRQRRIRRGESGYRESEFKSRCLYPADTVLRR